MELAGKGGDAVTRNLKYPQRLHDTLTSLSSHHRYFDFDRLAEVAKQVTRNLNRIIDVNYYPVDTARRSNMRHRPIGMGVQVSQLQISVSVPFRFHAFIM